MSGGEPWNADWRRVRARRWQTAATARHPFVHVAAAWWVEALTPRPPSWIVRLRDQWAT